MRSCLILKGNTVPYTMLFTDAPRRYFSLNVWHPQLRRINSWLLIVLAFSLPLSTSAITVTALLIMLCWFLEGGFREKWREISANPVCIAVCIFLGIMLLGLCWTDNLMAGLKAIGKLWKIWLLPVFITTVCWERRWWYVAAFIAGLTVTMLLIDLAWFDLLPAVGLGGQQLNILLTNHIVFTPMLAFSTYLLLHQLLWGGISGWKRWLTFALGAMMLLTLFITNGRVGQLVFFVLMALLLFQYFRRNVLKAVLLVLMLLPLVFITAYRFSPVFQGRMNEIRQNIVAFDNNPDTSVGLRLLYWKNSWAIIRQSPWFGVGTGGFTSAYAEKQQWSPSITPTDNPHNQYILITVQVGVFGLISLLSLFLTQIYQAGRMSDGWGRIRLAFPVFFLTIMLTDSYLNTSSSGFLFSLLSAVFYKNKLTG